MLILKRKEEKTKIEFPRSNNGVQQNVKNKTRNTKNNNRGTSLDQVKSNENKTFEKFSKVPGEIVKYAWTMVKYLATTCYNTSIVDTLAQNVELIKKKVGLLEKNMKGFGISSKTVVDIYFHCGQEGRIFMAIYNFVIFVSTLI